MPPGRPISVCPLSTAVYKTGGQWEVKFKSLLEADENIWLELTRNTYCVAASVVCPMDAGKRAGIPFGAGNRVGWPALVDLPCLTVEGGKDREIQSSSAVLRIPDCLWEVMPGYF